MTELEVLKIAKAAGEAEALRIWELDGKEDRGSCGGAMLELKKNSKLFKVASQSGEIKFSDAFVSLSLPAGIRSQNADIYQGQMRAFRNVLVEAGYEKAIKRFWTYID